MTAIRWPFTVVRQGPKVVAGLAASRDPIAPSKWTSPPKASVTGSPVGSRVAPARSGAVVVGLAVVAEASTALVVWDAGVACPGSSPPPQALNSSAARARKAATWRRMLYGRRATADSRLD